MSNANEPAYPEMRTEAAYDLDGRGDLYANTYSVGGLTKREYFAAMAMQGLLSGGEFIDAEQKQANSVAAYSVQQADALLAELERTA